MMHGDDFTTLGEEEDIEWFETDMQKGFEVNIRGRLGWEDKDMKRIRI